jgi:DNA-binding IclR family transcriptional regulator
MKLGSIDKSLQIIDLLSRNGQGLRLSDLSNKLNIPPSSAHHILQTLLPHDYVMQDPETKKYSLGFRFLEIGKRILDSLDIRKIANKHLNELHKACGEAVHLAMLRNAQVIYIDKIDSSMGRLSLATYVGFATDAYAAAGGKVLLSGLSPEEVRDLYRDRPLRKFGKRTITNLDQLLEELERIGRQGYAIDDEEYYEGVRCVAAPIRAGGKIVAAVSITGSVFTMTMDRINEQLKDLVVRTGERTSSEMRW